MWVLAKSWTQIRSREKSSSLDSFLEEEEVEFIQFGEQRLFRGSGRKGSLKSVGLKICKCFLYTQLEKGYLKGL